MTIFKIARKKHEFDFEYMRICDASYLFVQKVDEIIQNSIIGAKWILMIEHFQKEQKRIRKSVRSKHP